MRIEFECSIEGHAPFFFAPAPTNCGVAGRGIESLWKNETIQTMQLSKNKYDCPTSIIKIRQQLLYLCQACLQLLKNWHATNIRQTATKPYTLQTYH